MAADKDYLRQLAIAIRDEYRKGANTAYRVGSLLLSLIDTDANIESLSQYFIRKDKEDVAKEIITFLKGLVSNLVQSEGFSPGEFGSGFILRNDDGGSYLEIDRLLVRRIAYFVELVIKSLKHVGGSLVLTPASMVCSKVEEYDAYYRCYFEHEREGRFIYQEFVPGDQARAQEFNVKEGVNQNVASRFYWRLVIAVGDNYIDLSKSDAAVGSVAPQAGDDIVLLGNRDDVTRQNAIILSTIGDDAPSIKQYKGINSYSTEGKEITIISSVLNSFTGRFKSSVTGKDFDAMLDEFNTDLSKIKAQTDQEYTIWFEEYEPTLDNSPAVDWDDDDKIDHEYDIFYYSEAGLAWRFMMLDDGTFAWVPITDQQTLRALEKAKKAQDTADKVTADLEEIVSDGILSKLEKKEVLKDWLKVVDTYKRNESLSSLFEIDGGYDEDTDETYQQYLQAFDALAAYLNGGTKLVDVDTKPFWLNDSNIGENTEIVPTDYRRAWTDYYDAEGALNEYFSVLAKQLADAARKEADKANKDLADIVSDGVLSKLEKKEVLKEWQSIVSEYVQNTSNAEKYEVDSSDYTTAYMALGTYMNGDEEWDGNSTPAWLADLTTNQNIIPETYRNKWVSYYNAEIALLDSISEAIKETADNKRRNFVTQPVPPYDKGDTWSNATYEDLYKNDDLVCIRSKDKDEEFNIDDWQPVSDMNSGTKKAFESKIEQLESSITLEVATREALDGTVKALGIRIDGAEDTLDLYGVRIDAAEGSITSLGLRIDTAEETISLYADRFAENEASISALQVDLKSVNTLVVSAQGSADDAMEVANAAKSQAVTATMTGMYSGEEYNQTTNPWMDWPSGQEYKHVGAIWYNPDTEVTKRYTGTDNSNSWETVSDADEVYASATYVFQNKNKWSAIASKFNSSGTPTSTSGIVTTANFAGLFSEQIDEEGVATRAEISTYVDGAMSNIMITADQIDINGIMAVAGTNSVTIGGFTITSNSLTNNAAGNSSTGASIEIMNSSGTRFARLNGGAQGNAAEFRNDNGTAVVISAYGDASNYGLKVIGNVNSKAVHVTGSSYFITRKSNVEHTYISGLKVCTRTGNSLSASYDSYDPAFPSGTNVDFLVATGAVTLPEPANARGRIIFVKRRNAGSTQLYVPNCYLADGSFEVAAKWSSDDASRFFISDGMYWNEFYCK